MGAALFVGIFALPLRAWGDLNAAARFCSVAGCDPLLCAVKTFADLARTSAESKGWPLPEIQATGGFEGTGQ